jgi:hypothetical protein
LHLDYFATVQKFKDGQPEGKPVEYANASVLPAGYGIAISSSSPEAGYLYIVNDGPLPDGSQSINVLFPAYHAPAEIGAGQTIRIPQEQWNVLDEASGTESLYLVWSGEPVPELERAKDQTDALTNEGIVIRDSTQIAELRQLLAKYRVPEAQIRADESAHRTSLTSQKDVLVHLIQLKHL